MDNYTFTRFCFVINSHDTWILCCMIETQMLQDSDMIYIKTQVFRLLRYYSPAPRSIARSDWPTQNITYNMTSSIIQPYGLFIHSNYASFTKKGILNMPYISLMTRKNPKESLTTIFCTVTIYLYISFNRQLWMSR